MSSLIIKNSLVFLVSILLVSQCSFAVGTDGEAQVDRWIEPTDRVVTPHIRWMKPRHERPLRILFITYRLGMREVVEICQRFDVEREVFALELPKVFGDGRRGRTLIFPGTTLSDQETRLREKLAADYDCIVIGNIAWGAIPDWAQQSILQKVSSGTGLVGYLRDHKVLCNQLEEFRTTIEPVNRHSDIQSNLVTDQQTDEHSRFDPETVFGAFPFSALPAFSEYNTAVEFAQNTLDLFRYGKGRVVLLRGFPCPNYQILTPGIAGSFTDWHLVHYEYYHALVGHLFRWATQSQSDIHIRAPALLPETDRTKLTDISFDLSAESPSAVELQFVLRHAKEGTVVANETRSVVLEQPQSTIAFEVPSLPAGQYFADLWVKKDGKTVTYGSRFLRVTSEDRITNVVLQGQNLKQGDLVKSYSVKDTIAGQVHVETTQPELVVQIDQRDIHARLVARQAIPVPFDKSVQEIDFALQPPSPLSVLQRIEVRLMDGSTVIDTHREEFCYNDYYPSDDDVHYILWEGYTGDTFLNAHLAKIIRNAGFDLWWHAHAADERHLRVVGAFLREGFYEFPNLFYPPPVRPRPWGDPTPAEGGGYIRKPCLTDPAFLEHAANTYKKAAQSAGQYATMHYTLGSECSLTHGELEVCFSPTCIEHFRGSLKQEYGVIEKLNSEYDSSYTDWSEIVPVDYETASKTGQIPLWIDFRRNMDSVWANYYGLARDTISKVVPNAKVGCDASNDAGHSPKTGGLGGDDYWKLANAMSLSGPYFWPIQLDCVRDFSLPGTLIGGGWYGGYFGNFRAERKGDWHRWFTWYTLLRGANSFWVFQGSGGTNGGIECNTIAPDFSWYDFMDEGIRSVNTIQQGIGKLVMAMNRPDDGIAVLYSPASMLLANFTPEFPRRWDSLSATSIILPESNFQYRMISSEQLERGVLRTAGIRLLYLPYCQALSPNEVEEITAFVKSGGSVVADLRPGVADEHGKPYEVGALDRVLGVEHQTRLPLPLTGPVMLHKSLAKQSSQLPTTHTDGSLKLAGGTALGSVGQTPAVIVNRYGKGRTVLLNFAISDYILAKTMFGSSSTIRFTDKSTAMQTASLIQQLFSKLGVEPAVTMAASPSGCHVYRFEHNETQLLGILQEIPPFLPGVGPKPMKELDEISKLSNTVKLQLGESAHIYDLLGQGYLGHSQTITSQIKPGQPHLLATLPYKVKSISVVPMSESVLQGEEMSFAIEVNTEGVPAGLHVMRTTLTDPEGNSANMYSRNVLASSGKCVVRIQFSLDENIGEWTLTVRDVISGVSESRRFLIKRW